jgi:deoxyribodipyrimidine photolyase-like uncharacterized protein
MKNSNIRKNTSQLFNSELKVINIGLQHFAETLRNQGIKVEQVEWQPQSEKNTKEEYNDLLDAMGMDD